VVIVYFFIKTVFTILFLLYGIYAYSQLTGGQQVFSFINHIQTTQYQAMGGKHVSFIHNNSNAFLQNPALWQAEASEKLSVDFRTLYNTTNSIGSYIFKANPNVHKAIAIAYNNYGRLERTDASGNVIGNFNAFDYAIIGSYGINKNKPFSIGTNIKFIGSSIDGNNGLALAADMGMHYLNKENGFYAGLVIKNIGVTLKPIGTEGNNPLPLDIQLGATKKINNAPFAFSLTLHQLQRFNTFYNDTIFTNSTTGNIKKPTVTDKLLNHIVLAFHIIPNENLSFDVGYGFKRRRELIFPGINNGLTGIHAGFNITKKDFQCHYAIGFFITGKPIHQLNITVPLFKKIF
jgi:hypothetical protein